MINYFNTTTSQSNDNLFLNLIVEYLLSHKKIVNIESVEELKRAAKKSTSPTESSSLFENFTKIKDLTQLVRLFGDKKFTSTNLALNSEKHLNEQMQRYLNSNQLTNNKRMPEFDRNLIQIFLLTPILFQNSKSLLDSIEQANEFILSELNQNRSECELETDSFFLSLNVWSTMILNNRRQLNAIESQIEKLVALMGNFYEKGASYEKCLNHLLRTLNYYLTMECGDTDLSGKIESILLYVKSQLASPYHETRLNAINVLAHYFKSALSQIEPTKLDDDELHLFDICLKAEMTAASLEDYRKKIYYIQRLDTNVCTKYFEIEQLKDVNQSIDYYI